MRTATKKSVLKLIEIALPSLTNPLPKVELVISFASNELCLTVSVFEAVNSIFSLSNAGPIYDQPVSEESYSLAVSAYSLELAYPISPICAPSTEPRLDYQNIGTEVFSTDNTTTSY